MVIKLSSDHAICRDELSADDLSKLVLTVSEKRSGYYSVAGIGIRIRLERLSKSL